MDQNATLQKLLEAADLAKMVEELVSPGHLERLAPASLSGIRVTLRALRETMLTCHNAVAAEISNRNRSAQGEQQGAAGTRIENPAIVRTAAAAEQPRMIKKDLRSSLGQMIERTVNPGQ